MTRCVRVITENAAVDRAFDYELGEAWADVRVGDRVRVDFNHRSLRAWVVEEVPPRRELKPVKKWLGRGPAPEMIDLLRWAATRWCAPLSRFLLAASPPVVVRELPDPPPRADPDLRLDEQATALAPGVVLAAPTSDPLGLVVHAHLSTLHEPGSLLVVVPTEGWARRLSGRLEQRGLAVAQGEAQWDRMRAGWPVIVGARGAALAPTARLRGAVVIDADDEALRSESSPTWDALSVVVERCRRDRAPWWCTSVAPSPTLLSLGEARPWGSLASVASGWPRVSVLDRREGDPHDGVLLRPALDAAHRALAGSEAVAVAVILQRLGHGRLYACRHCGELARCAVCGQAEVPDEGHLTCAEGHERRANFCRHCSSTNLRAVRVGVSTLARDVAAQLGQSAQEVTAGSTLEATSRVLVGTEAVFNRVRRCGVVIFVDFDQYLLAPRESARRAALVAVAKAGRLVGARAEGRGEVLVQSRRHDEVIDALVRGDVRSVIEEDRANAELLSLPPYGALARVSGAAAADFVAQVDESVSVRRVGEGYVLRAPDVETLTRALRAVARPPGRLRLEID